MAYTHPGGEMTLMPPPEGYISNFAHPQRQYTNQLYIGAGILSAVTILFMTQRIFTNLWVQRKVVLEDG